ncbi:hypothetical protein [Pseudomonas gingeri]|uniref:hypothetical protein n=1 Tax=Pseudomonas gingeri TaxID=117681 RepID=UPI0015A0D99C|nr:hypothetical protein [Pseudomonas gingeri]NWA03758.1 hypothetical protein [Pseudomonas gingeri]NWA14617.1 hypothetical protein [Pseudomonas gingeri]NWA58745.1 hypothetical protein [Pseudomonas gingeri]NWA94489.1 hypothetical protein [Pseudomonas gingeri]NWB01145.1 hypothetical protein [Pseudomonas gingeri]
MNEVKRYHLFTGEPAEGCGGLGRINVVLCADHDRVTAERDALQKRLTAADERVDSAIALLECILDTGELTREKHLELEADICQLVTDFWGDRKTARIPSPPRCPDCGYTEQDCREHMDHHLCGSPEPAAARKP